MNWMTSGKHRALRSKRARQKQRMHFPAHVQQQRQDQQRLRRPLAALAIAGANVDERAEDAPPATPWYLRPHMDAAESHDLQVLAIARDVAAPPPDVLLRAREATPTNAEQSTPSRETPVIASQQENVDGVNARCVFTPVKRAATKASDQRPVHSTKRDGSVPGGQHVLLFDEGRAVSTAAGSPHRRQQVLDVAPARSSQWSTDDKQADRVEIDQFGLSKREELVGSQTSTIVDSIDNGVAASSSPSYSEQDPARWQHDVPSFTPLREPTEDFASASPSEANRSMEQPDSFALSTWDLSSPAADWKQSEPLFATPFLPRSGMPLEVSPGLRQPQDANIYESPDRYFAGWLPETPALDPTTISQESLLALPPPLEWQKQAFAGLNLQLASDGPIEASSGSPLRYASSTSTSSIVEGGEIPSDWLAILQPRSKASQCILDSNECKTSNAWTMQCRTERILREIRERPAIGTTDVGDGARAMTSIAIYMHTLVQCYRIDERGQVLTASTRHAQLPDNCDQMEPICSPYIPSAMITSSQTIKRKFTEVD